MHAALLETRCSVRSNAMDQPVQTIGRLQPVHRMQAAGSLQTIGCFAMVASFANNWSSAVSTRRSRRKTVATNRRLFLPGFDLLVL